MYKCRTVNSATNKSNTGKALKSYVESFPRGKQILQDGEAYYGVFQDKLLISNAVKRGIPNNVFNEIKSGSPFTEQQWSDFLNINIRTLQRYKKDNTHIFKPNISERIFELAEVVSLGNKVFDSSQHFNLWLNTPSVSLGNNAPINLLDNSYGIDLVLAELNRVEYGIFV